MLGGMLDNTRNIMMPLPLQEEDPLVPGISQEEAEELKETIALLETQLNTTSDQLAAKEESEKKLCK